MDAPSSFWAIAMRFHQDGPSFVEPSEIAIADYLVDGLNAVERQELSSFLDKVLRMPDAGMQLLRLWKRSQSDFGFARASDIGAFFAVLRGRL